MTDLQKKAAEKAKGLSGRLHYGATPEDARLIASALVAFAEECLEVFHGRVVPILEAEAKAEGRREGLLQAAEVAESEPDGYHDDVTIGQVIADKIRSLAEEK